MLRDLYLILFCFTSLRIDTHLNWSFYMLLFSNLHLFSGIVETHEFRLLMHFLKKIVVEPVLVYTPSFRLILFHSWCYGVGTLWNTEYSHSVNSNMREPKVVGVQQWPPLNLMFSVCKVKVDYAIRGLVLKTRQSVDKNDDYSWCKNLIHCFCMSFPRRMTFFLYKGSPIIDFEYSPMRQPFVWPQKHMCLVISRERM